MNPLRAEGRDIISFGIGEPDFDTPANIVAAAKAARRRPDEVRAERWNAPASGGDRQGKPRRRAASPWSPTRWSSCPGAKPFILYTIATLVNEGEEVVYPNPGGSPSTSPSSGDGSPIRAHAADGGQCLRLRS